MTIATMKQLVNEINLKKAPEKTIDGRSRNAIMSIALKLNGKPRIVDWSLMRPAKLKPADTTIVKRIHLEKISNSKRKMFN